jgi:hypothetical protein
MERYLYALVVGLPFSFMAIFFVTQFLRISLLSIIAATAVLNISLAAIAIIRRSQLHNLMVEVDQ